MALQSQLFRGDSKLEGAAVSDAAHIVQGARGEHVQKIQLALISLDGAVIDADGVYGPATAAAVLAYKRKRGIINRSRQTQADNIVGEMTIAALDREMVDKEKPPTGKVCSLDSGQIQGPSGIGPQLGFAISAGAVGVGAALTPSDQGKVRAPEAAKWVVAAELALNRVAGILAVNDPTQIANMKKSTAWKALETHFHVDDATDNQVVQFASRVFSNISVTLSKANTLFIDGPPTATFFAQAHLGGTNFPTNPAIGRIEFGRRYLKGKKFFQTAVIIHEAAHFADATVDHRASELPKFDGFPVDGAIHKGNTKKYSQLNATEAMQNAYSFAQFALHMFIGFDKRLHFKSLPGDDFESE
jgi:hypothetical protein